MAYKITLTDRFEKHYKTLHPNEKKQVILLFVCGDYSKPDGKITPITKGWSSDKKYCIETVDGRRMLLRVSDIAEYDCKKAEYGMMERVYAVGVLTPQPIDFGLCDGVKVFILCRIGLIKQWRAAKA